MRLTIKYCLICIFLCGQFSINAQNNSTNLFHSGDSLFALGQFRKAYIEYERISYQSTDNEFKAIAHLHQANSLKQINEFEKAQRSLERVNYYGLTDSLHYAVRHETALCAYLASNFTDAEAQFVQMRYYLKDSKIISKTSLLEVLTYNELLKWDTAQIIVENYINGLNLNPVAKDSLLENFKLIYDKKEIPKIRSVKKAKAMSTFLPGLGQIYAGYPLEGVLNFGLQAASLGLGVIGIYYKYYLTGYFGGFALFQKFYFGGITRTEYLVEKKNYQNIRKFNDNVKMKLMKF
ncbi:MAG: hypothetical protein K9J13_02210 [Saprospiraceae bacterium]|nr:hypothetical protein [Saprospiraceae bacterium]